MGEAATHTATEWQRRCWHVAACVGLLQPWFPSHFPHSGKAAAKACFRNDPRSDLQPGEPCHSPVMFFVHQVVPGPERHQVSVVCWGRDGHGARAAHVGVTQLVGEDLQLIGGETIVVPKHMIVGRPACSLKADRRVRERSRGPLQHGAAETDCAGPDASQGTQWKNS